MKPKYESIYDAAEYGYEDARSAIVCMKMAYSGMWIATVRYAGASEECIYWNYSECGE